MHPLAIPLYPLFLAVDFLQRYAVAAWGLMVLIVMLIACSPSWSEEALSLPSEWPVALAILGLLSLIPVSVRFWKWYRRAHEHRDEPQVKTSDFMPGIPEILPTMGTLFLLSLGMMLIGRLNTY